MYCIVIVLLTHAPYERLYVIGGMQMSRQLLLKYNFVKQMLITQPSFLTIICMYLSRYKYKVFIQSVSMSYLQEAEEAWHSL